jgi:ankyrin repeat protein
MKTRWKIAIALILLLAAGMRWIVYDVSRHEAFLTAAYAGQTDIVGQALKDGESIDATDPRYGATALIFAAQQGHLETVKLLLDNHADMNVLSKLGQTALGQAAFNGHLDVVKLLLEHGAKLDARLRPGVLSAVADHPDIVKLLPAEEPAKAQGK